MAASPIQPNVFRSFVFGVEDSVVSTVGLISGIAIVGSSRPAILVTGTILIFVEAFSMAVGDLLSDNAVREFSAQKETPLSRSFSGALVMFFSYLASGFAVILPYVIAPPPLALPASIALSLALLFALGAVEGSVARISLLKNGLTMAFVGGAAILIGMGAGLILQNIGGVTVF